ncbi:hypothetical protein A2954_02855 [Candidatus Roizmanbacteria bacterium RIFCSPLOWO2_01_FULL_37_12]|uniref:Uncharacterized protein n=1 Tax=Candidatus Roizmanbacteria bacterium RIFCSPLOWO2_01_FULL_37_12 TaxID=1802056 RepID=A0A1F7IAD4_9BACT|nr:MAG: hypothetical protein A3D76_03550 [Candidatus Roizmanbacteria bacterium RIFCSPHIGHO2_02_FULL_37_9b]OGK40316.1 MAG: hypothetical protein A2954_02855 [Candidatus Roizmanbacteria bacterium RIFCSPLOWO2_01_FULL_37_12]
MTLFLHESVHILISLIIGYLVWCIYKKPFPSFFAAFLGGVLIDLDHLVDYFFVYGFNFNLVNFLKGYHFDISNKLYVPFHAWEYVVILNILYIYFEKKWKQKKVAVFKIILAFVLALNLGIYSHLIIDTFSNGVESFGYSLIYRALNKFRSDKVSN